LIKKARLCQLSSGWHLPSYAEWNILTESVGGEKIAGKFLKATNGWNSNSNGQDTYGFAALSGGGGGNSGKFYYVGEVGFWWTATKNKDTTNSAYIQLMDNNDGVYWDRRDKFNLLSVRCLQDRSPYEELEQEAEKWIENGCSFEEKQGEYFSFSCGAVNPCTDCGSGENKWTATSEVEISDCPAGSVWIMVSWAHEGGEGGNNKIPPECKSITPIIITDYNFEKSYYE